MSTPSTIAEAELSILMQLGRPDRRRSHRPHYGIRELPRGVAFKGARIRLLLASEIERVGVNDYRITDKGMATRRRESMGRRWVRLAAERNSGLRTTCCPPTTGMTAILRLHSAAACCCRRRHGHIP